MRKKGSPEELERVRLIAANMFDEDDKEPAQIARLLQVDVQTVRHWRRIYKAKGRSGLLARKPPGGPTKLDAERRRQLVEMLSHEPAHHGYDAWLWTTKLVARLVLDKFGVEHHHDHVGVILRGLGFSPQKPACRAKERDEARIDAWRQKAWPELLKKVRPKAAPLCSPTKSDS
jgi:transposase